VIPPAVRQGIVLSDSALEAELLRVTDHLTDELFRPALDLGGLVFANRLSRVVIDPERFRDDADEVMAGRGVGAVYRRTTSGQILREPSSAEHEHLLRTYFDPYAAALRKAVDVLLERFGRCLIVDGHSYPAVPLGWELQPTGRRPDVCLG